MPLRSCLLLNKNFDFRSYCKSGIRRSHRKKGPYIPTYSTTVTIVTTSVPSCTWRCHSNRVSCLLRKSADTPVSDCSTSCPQITLQKFASSLPSHELDANLMNLTTTTRNAEAVPQEEACEGVALDDDDVGSVVGDAIPLRGVQMDNKVHDFPLFSCRPTLFRSDRSYWNAYRRHQIGPISSNL